MDRSERGQMIEAVVAVVPGAILQRHVVVRGIGDVLSGILIVMPAIALDQVAAAAVHVKAVRRAGGGPGVLIRLVVLNGGAGGPVREVNPVIVIVGDRVRSKQAAGAGRQVDTVLVGVVDLVVSQDDVVGGARIDGAVFSPRHHEAVDGDVGAIGEAESVGALTNQGLMRSGIVATDVDV